MGTNSADIKLKILVMGDSVYGETEGPKREAFKRLDASLRRSPIVQYVEFMGYNIDDWAYPLIQQQSINTIFIDPFSVYRTSKFLGAATNFIFDVRKKFPEVVFVLYMDFNRIKNIHLDSSEEEVAEYWSEEEKKRFREHFYAGERSRFARYYKLDQNLTGEEFDAALDTTLRLCQGWLADYKERVKARAVPPKKRFPFFPRDLVGQATVLVVGPAVAGIGALTGLDTILGKSFLVLGIALFFLTLLLMVAVRILDQTQGQHR